MAFSARKPADREDSPTECAPVGGHMLFDLRHQIVAVLVMDLVPPAEMIESVVTYAHFLPGRRA